jgi:inward rectifier potassium channel
MLAMSNLHFFLVILVFYILVNLGFAVIYYFIGVEHLAGMLTHTETEKFGEAFFFSAQTFTTVGYGRISPTGFTTSTIAAFQALIGLLSFAVATGLMYGRFSKPKAFLKFSENALISPYKDITALMIRVATYKNATLTDAEARITLQMRAEENGKVVNRFFNLDLELQQVSALTLSWTLVHPISESSPIYNYSKEDFENNSGEIIVFIKAFDDMFSNTVVSRTSYIFNEVVYAAKFIPMFHRDETNHTTILDFEKLDLYEAVSINRL